MWIWTNINQYVVFLVQRQQFWHIIFWWGLTITEDFQDGIFACESSLPSTNYSWIACMTNIVIVKLQKISLSKPNVKIPLGMIWTYNFSFIIFNLFNTLLIGYKWITRVNGKLLQKDINEDHEHTISISQINLSEARENFFKNTKAHHAKKDISEALEQFHRKELCWRDVSAAYLASLATIWGLYFI